MVKFANNNSQYFQNMRPRQSYNETLIQKHSKSSAGNKPVSSTALKDLISAITKLIMFIISKHTECQLQ